MNLVRSILLIALLLTAATAVIASAAEKPNIEKLHGGCIYLQNITI